MINRRQAFIAIAILFTAGLIVGRMTSEWHSSATAEEQKSKPKLFRSVGLHAEGDTSFFGVYCDEARGNLIYTYVVSPLGSGSASSNLVVLKDGCKGIK